MTVPPNVTPYGAIAYRLDALAGKLAEMAEAGAEAAMLWDIVDDLVSLNLASDTIAARVRACRPCTSSHPEAWRSVHVSEHYDDGCYTAASTLLQHLLEGDIS